MSKAEELFNENTKLAYKISSKFVKFASIRGIYKEDLEQAALWALWKQCLSYDSTEYAFSTIAFRNIKRDVSRYINSKSNYLIPIKDDNGYRSEQASLQSEDLPLGSENERASELLNIKTWMNETLTKDERSLLDRRVVGQSCLKIANELNISPQTVMNRLNKMVNLL